MVVYSKMLPLRCEHHSAHDIAHEMLQESLFLPVQMTQNQPLFYCTNYVYSLGKHKFLLD